MKIIFKIISILSLFLLTILVGCRDSKIANKQDAAAVTYSTDSTTVKFEGVVTAVKNDCWADGECSIEVNNEWWIAIVYGLRDPSTIPKQRGQSKEIRFTEDYESIGKMVKVYAKIEKNNSLTLEGNNAYYVEVIENKILKE
ncbi:hypothetical protein [Rasiella sp. SM2506]|uniref:hypothetical protein n=1 Tax=Rasiella sp. SM2506 TaxID=3423914 RepID=UPI003D7A75F2